MINNKSPIGRLKEIYWISHFLFFSIILILSSLTGKIYLKDLYTSFNFNLIILGSFFSFLIVNYLFLRAIEERFHSDKYFFRTIYTLLLTTFSLLFTIFSSEDIHKLIYVIPVVLISLTSGSILGLISSAFFGYAIFWHHKSIHTDDLTVILCLALLAWILGQISQINFRYASQLENEKNFLKDLIETFSEGIIICDQSGYILLCNKQIEQIFIINKDELIGKNEAIIWEQCSMPYHKWMPNFMNMEAEIAGRTYLISRFTLKGLEETANCFATVINDITELQQQKNKMQRLATLSAVGELAAGAAHEIRNPLTTVRGFIQLMQAKWPDPKLADLSQLSLEELDRVNGIVTSMLQLARPERSESKLLNINEIVNETWDLYTYSGMCKGIHYEKHLDEKLKPFKGSDKQIKQVLLNIMQNAERACSKDDTILIRTYGDDKHTCIDIKDTGRGISPEHIEKILHPFFTTDPAGTGLGLAICNRIISDHNGTLKVTSELGVGTIFTIVFPVHRPTFSLMA